MKTQIIMKLYIVSLFVLFGSLTWAQKSGVAYEIYNSKGKKVSYKNMLKECTQKDITFFGEFHNNSIAHWLQLEVSNDLAIAKDNKLTLGFEMFEADQQLLIDKWLKSEITDKEMEDSLRLWSNYKTDYKPLMKFAKERNIYCVADNVPRRIASVAFKQGRDGLLNIEEKELPFMAAPDFLIDTTLSQYNFMLSMAGGDHSKGYTFVLAQAIKDATMAKFIDQKWTLNTHFIHFNGAFHTDFHQGIIWYLEQLRPNLKYTSITTVEQDSIETLDKDHIGRADFIICVKSNVTKTH